MAITQMDYTGTGESNLNYDLETLTAKNWTLKTCTGRIRGVVWWSFTAGDYGVVNVDDLSQWVMCSRPQALSVSNFFKDLSADKKSIYYNEDWASQTVNYVFIYE